MKEQILVVDDDAEDLATMKTILENEGYSVVAVEGGSKALEALTGNGFDMILIDIQMNTLSGYDLLRLLREKLNHKVKMVYVTIVPEKEVNMSDIDGFIQKPFEPDHFLAFVKSSLQS